MSMSISLVRFAETLRKFRVAQGGNVALTFAIATVPVVGAVGAAVDYSRANSARTAMQAAIDSTALMLSKEAQNMNSAALNTKANTYFNAMFKRTDVTGIIVTPTFTTVQAGNFKLDLTGTGNVKATMANLIGTSTMKIGTKSQVLWGMKKLEVALALDNTGSMASSGKMTELKKASKNLLTTLKNAAKTNGDVKVAIIPFDTTVNLGTSYKNNNWFDIDSIDCNGWSSGNGCNSGNWKNNWEGCVRDRTYPYDAQDTAPSTGTPGTLFPVYDCGSLAKLMPLTYDWTALNAKIDEMQPNGNTNVSIGMAWGWHALTSGAPLSEGAAPAADLDKVIILLTDGANTESWKNSNNTSVTSQSAIDARTLLTCTNAKAANIRIYTVRVIDGNADMLSKCATNPSMFYDVDNASELSNVFSAIAQNLANLRLAK